MKKKKQVDEFIGYSSSNASAGGGVSTGIVSTTGMVQPNTTITTITTASIAGTLTPEEQAELQLLEEQNIQDVKRKKIEAFEKLPSSIRQRIVDDIMWGRFKAQIDQILPDKSNRQIELEQRRNAIGNVWHGSTVWVHNGAGASGNTKVRGFQDVEESSYEIEGLTDEDLIQAHAAASLEETLNDE